MVYQRFIYELCDDDDECSTQIDLGSIFDEHVIDVSSNLGDARIILVAGVQQLFEVGQQKHTFQSEGRLKPNAGLNKMRSDPV